jgi:hypothetical protein
MRLLRYITEQAWTLAGTGLVLITLSGSTRSAGIWISIAATALHLVSYFLPEDDA